MLLSMDKDGQIYQAASHRPDGKGFEKIPEVVGMGDVAYGMPYAMEEAKRAAYNKSLDHFNNLDRIAHAKLLDKRRAEVQRASHLQGLENEWLRANQANLIEEALIQSMNGADFSTNQIELSGFGLSSDGQMGKSNRDMALEAAVLQGMGATVPVGMQSYISDVDESEAEQYKLMQEAGELRLKNAYAQAMPVGAEVVDEARPASLPPVIAPASSGAIKTVQPTSQGGESKQLVAGVSNKMLLAIAVGAFILLRK